MASEVAQSTHYIGKVLTNGHLEIPKTIIEQMGLKHGDEVEIAIRKVTKLFFKKEKFDQKK